MHQTRIFTGMLLVGALSAALVATAAASARLYPSKRGFTRFATANSYKKEKVDPGVVGWNTSGGAGKGGGWSNEWLRDLLKSRPRRHGMSDLLDRLRQRVVYMSYGNRLPSDYRKRSEDILL